ncbi:sigma-70 family RNA polymerase sigma factor [Virgibacillus halophilus]|uniref:Sigma-70 family RNA polymerase sigma factor n=1 Tax=Tigheibacillus halophilus TaxID=361280 RepID=A0ABU5C2X3_9BACI|nr:sigma-70 family RNA polymerase sigma factor [Virgibacillus halophilus]
MSQQSKNNLFETIYEQNKYRIYHQLHKLHTKDPNNDHFFEIGLHTPWIAREKYYADTGMMATYFNYEIRRFLLNRIRDESKQPPLNPEAFDNAEQSFSLSFCAEDSLIYNADFPAESERAYIWERVRLLLTVNEWKWVLFGLIKGMTAEKIALQENTTVEAVKSWDMQTRKQLWNACLQAATRDEIDSEEKSAPP